LRVVFNSTVRLSAREHIPAAGFAPASECNLQAEQSI